ncbi:type III secretion system inner membrane ring subunit SctD [Vibrio coralliilyticus]|uniref:type III secretion system inner membrane ring subunit SctD n=1 Tax=Vibrio coralliilyticus TaxID=190893 RepID=UPI0015606F28|nr:type III secretion system inner membrane ring subunit SctD [Vibrio coralliilyticus]NRF16150.1 type III secretion system inner membrane ring subunit SctD [Vibrio coralliilyticus]
MENSTKLLWLTGPMQGRELRLPQGDLSMGPSGDIMVPLAERELLNIRVDEKGVFVRDTVKVWANGSLANTEEALPMGEPIEICGVGLVLGKADQALEWQKLPAHVKTSQSRWRKMVLLAMTLITIVLMAFTLMLPAKTQPVFDPQLWLQHQLNVPALHQVEGNWSPDGVVTLTGYCDNSTAMAKLKEGLKLHSIRFTNSAVCTDTLISNVESVLSANGYQNINVLPSRRMGEFRISGAIQSGEKWDKVTRELEQVQGLKHWQVANDIGGYVQKFIEALRGKGLLEGLMVERRQDSIMVTGQFQDDVRSQIRQVSSELMANTGQSIDVRFENIPVRDNLSRYLSGQIVSFGGNSSHPFVELSNGTRLKLNSKLDSGYVVSHIDLKGLDLSRDGELIHIPFIL